MLLDVNNDRTYKSPDAATIERELRSLDDEFAILIADEMTFLQVFVDSEDGIILEYQDGSIDEHFEAVEAPETLEPVIEAFVSYSQDGTDWQDRFQWERMEMVRADYLVLVASPLGEIKDPLECEHRVQMPDICMDELSSLYALLADITTAGAARQFAVVDEIFPPGHDAVLLSEMPARFQQELAGLSAEAIPALAENWRATDGFPEDYDSDEVAALIEELAAIANYASDTETPLVVCDLE